MEPLSIEEWTSDDAPIETEQIVLKPVVKGGRGKVIEVLKDGLNPMTMVNVLPMDLLSKVLGEAGGGKEARYTEDEQVRLAMASKSLIELIPYYVVRPRVILGGNEKPGEVHIARFHAVEVNQILSLMKKQEEAKTLESFRNRTLSGDDRCDVQAVRTTPLNGSRPKEPAPVPATGYSSYGERDKSRERGHEESTEQG